MDPLTRHKNYTKGHFYLTPYRPLNIEFESFCRQNPNAHAAVVAGNVAQ